MATVDTIARGMAGEVDSELDDLEVRVEALENEPGIAIDSEINGESVNPVENRAVYEYTTDTIASNNENYIGEFNSVADLEAYTGTVTDNDYAIVKTTDSLGNVTYARYTYDADTQTWNYAYSINNTSYTANQWATIDSGMTSADKDKLDGIEAEANRTIVDGALSDISENPVENQVATAGLDLEYNKADDVSISQAGYDALGSSKYSDAKNYYVYNAYYDPSKDQVVYGWHVDPDESNPDDAITYLMDAVGKTPAAMGETQFNYGDWKNAFFMPKPCMVKYDGTVDYYLDPNDYTKKLDGTASDIADPNYGGNAMMQWPKIWFKFEEGVAEGEGYFYCSNRKVDNSYHCYCNIDSNNNEIDYFYTAIYNGTGTSKMRSISGVQTNEINGCGYQTGAVQETNAKANNTTENVEWYIEVWSDRMLINALLILISKSLNSQAKFGIGFVAGSQSTRDNYLTGTANDKGLFYGSLSDQDTTVPVKVFGMENWWGHSYHRIAGLIGSDSGYLYKMTYNNYDGSTATSYNSTGEGYLTAYNRLETALVRPSSNLLNKCNYGQYGYLPITTSLSSFTTYYSDYFYTGSGYVLVGGVAVFSAGAGESTFNLSYGFDVSSYYYTASLSLKPLAAS